MDDFTLAEARQKARECRRRLHDGVDLAAEAKAARTPDTTGKTFKAVATEFIASNKAAWKNAKHGAQWQATLDQHAVTLMDMPVADIGIEDVLAVLRPIWTTRTETASRLRGRIENILAYAIAMRWRPADNPAVWKGRLSALLPAPGKVAKVEHHAALPWKDMKPVMARLASSRGTAARCAMFTILTATRSSEARCATWAEIDEKNGVWVIPAARMKGGREHRIPLAHAALAILAEMSPNRVDGGSLIFEGGRKGKPLSDVAVSKALHIAAGDDDVTVHGCRSTFRDWCAEAAQVPVKNADGTEARVPVPREVAEAALAHSNRDKTEAAYARSDMLDRRRDLMVEWANWCT